jgi:hypothetical protein
MTPESTEHIRELPIYQLGFADGRDVGFRIALDAITQERVTPSDVARHLPRQPCGSAPACLLRGPSRRRVQGDWRAIPPVTHD